MTDSVLVDLLVLSLLLAVNARLFFVARGQRDAMVLLAPVALFICVLGLFAWDVSLPKAVILILALCVFLENFHGLWRFRNRLYVDYFPPLLWLVSIVNILVILGLGALVILLRPLPASPDSQAAQRLTALSGSVRSGLAPRSSLFDTADVMMLQCKPLDDEAPWSERGARVTNPTEFHAATPGLPLVLWVTDGRTSVSRVEPVAAALAPLGYEVVVADFNRNLVSSSRLRLQGVFFPDKMRSRQATLERESSFQYEALIDYFGGERGLAGRTVFLLGDGCTGQGARAASLLNPFVAGFYIINGEDSLGNRTEIPDWPEGFGPLGETAPWVNYLMGRTPVLESRDETRFHSIAAAQQAHRAFSAMQLAGQETDAEAGVSGGNPATE